MQAADQAVALAVAWTLLYHFGSRDGPVRALVEAVEQRQRDVLGDLADVSDDLMTLMPAMWVRVSSPELRPFVRLFFECVAATGGRSLTEPWIDAVTVAGEHDRAVLRLGIVVMRGLLIDVLDGDDRTGADRAFDVFVTMFGSRDVTVTEITRAR